MSPNLIHKAKSGNSQTGKSKESDHDFTLFEKMQNGFAFCKMISNKKQPVDFEFVWVNKVFENLTNSKNLKSKKASGAFPAIISQNSAIMQAFSSMVLTGKPARLETISFNPDAKLSMSAYRAEKNHFIIIVEEITERIQASVELPENTEIYRNLVDNAGESIVVAQDGMLKFVNQRTSAITGYSLQELQTRPFSDFIYKEDQKMVAEAHFKRLNFKDAQPLYHFRIVKKDNSIIWVSNHAEIINWNGKPASLNFMTDVTDQVLKEERLVQSENLNRTLVNHIPQRIFIKDRNSNYVIINESYAKDLGIRPDEVKGKNDFDFFPEEYVKKFQQDDQQVLEKGILINTVEKYMIDGHQRWTHVTKLPYRDAEGHITGVLGIFDDITEQKLAEEKLKESQLRFQKTFETSSDSILINRLDDGVYVEVNEGFIKMLGYSREDVIGRSSLELSIWQNSNERDRLVEGLKTSGHIENMEAWFRKKSGEKIYGIMSASVITINNIPHIISITRNITERIQNEENLKLFRSLVDQSSDAIEVIDPESARFIDVNERSCKELGYSREELLTMKIFDINPGVDPVVYGQQIKEVIRNGSMLYEGFHRRKDGTTFPVEVNIRHVRLDREYHVAVVRNITERKIAEQSVRLQSAALQAAANAIIITDINGTIIWINKAFSDLTGYSEKEALGNNPREIINSGLTAQAVYQDMWKTITRGDVWHGELINRRKNGSLYNEEMIITPLRNQQGQIINYIAIKQEITERIKATEEITHLNRELEHRIDIRTKELNSSIKELESFTHSISHDLRAPLRSMNSYASILKEEYPGKIDEEGIRYLSIIHKNSLKMGNLLDALLNYTYIGRKELNKSMVNMNDLVEEIVNGIKMKRVIRAEFTIKKIEYAEADHEMISEVWTNLIDNAIKFSRNQPAPLIEIGSENQANEIIYYVKDNGTGFNKKYSHKLFGIFQRLHDETVYEGTGIGLAIIKRIITRHQGRVWAESGSGEGAVFYFTLPHTESKHS